jgi:hypothetical protein
MSHFTKIKTNITEEDLLIKTIDKLKLSWSKEKTLINLYNKEQNICDIAIKQENGHKIGFAKKNQSYELIYDEMFWVLPMPVSLFNEKISTYYVLNSINKNLLKNGFEIKNIIKENENSNLKIKINALRFN